MSLWATLFHIPESQPTKEGQNIAVFNGIKWSRLVVYDRHLDMIAE